LADACARETVEALIIQPDRLRALLVAEAELGERIMRALIVRRVGLLERGAGEPVIVGRAENGDVLVCRAFSAAMAVRISASILKPIRAPKR
jgi:thioredoxin reductase (NADPH)